MATPNFFHLIVFGKGERGAACLRALLEKNTEFKVLLAVSEKTGDEFHSLAIKSGVAAEVCTDPNAAEFVGHLKKLNADALVLAGYGKLLQEPAIAAAETALNLHGGCLPQYRGSSPMNWSLIRGETEAGISIIRVVPGIDAGPILAESHFPLSPEMTIQDLHLEANRRFPGLLISCLQQLRLGTAKDKKQDPNISAYFPLRSADDGFIIWDLLTAEEVHNLVRGLTSPYPCAFTFYHDREVKIIKTELTKRPYYGVAGKIYRVTKSGILVCAKDRCLWIRSATFSDNKEDLLPRAQRYDSFLSLRNLLLRQVRQGTVRRDL